MRQAVLVEPKHIEFREVEAPKASDLKEHQVLLNIKRIGICGSEIHSYHGCHPATFYPVVQGHEYSAVVVATGMAVTICKAGDVVTARPQLACGKCKPCQRGEYNICEELRVQAFQANGAAQDFFVVDDDRIAVLPEGMSLDYGAMIEPVAVAAHATMRGGDLKGKNLSLIHISEPTRLRRMWLYRVPEQSVTSWRSSLRQEEPNGFLLPM